MLQAEAASFGGGEESAAEMGMFQEQWNLQCGVPGASVGEMGIQITEPEDQDSTTWVLEEEGVCELEDMSVLRHVPI